MAIQGRRRFISVLVYKIYKLFTLAPRGRRFRCPLHGRHGPCGIDGTGRRGRQGKDRWPTSESAEGFVSGGSPSLCRFGGSGPLLDSAGGADHRGSVRGGPSAIDPGETTRPTR